jgi:hypothetical protein
MKFVAMDIETDGLDANRIWVICSKDLDTGETIQFLNPSHIDEEKEKFFEYCKTVVDSGGKFVFHNGLGFDVPVLHRLIGPDCVPYLSVIDTLIVSRMIDYEVKDGHSLKAWGIRLGLFKGEHKDWSKLSQEMIDYCHQDVAVTQALFERFRKVIFDKAWADALRCEHDIQILCEEMTTNGFKFDKAKAEEYLKEVEDRMAELEAGFQRDFPPKLEEVNRLKYRVKEDGTLFSTVVKAKEKYPVTDVYGDELICFDWVSFDPASPKQRIDRLWDAGWTPVDKTKGHIQYEREQRDKARQSWRKIR